MLRLVTVSLTAVLLALSSCSGGAFEFAVQAQLVSTQYHNVGDTLYSLIPIGDNLTACSGDGVQIDFHSYQQSDLAYLGSTSAIGLGILTYTQCSLSYGKIAFVAEDEQGPAHDLVINRFDANSAIDTSFAIGPTVRLSAVGNGQHQFPAARNLSDGRVVVASYFSSDTTDLVGFPFELKVRWFSAAGIPGPIATKSTDGPSLVSGAPGLGVDSQDRIVVVYSRTLGPGAFNIGVRVVRYLSDGSVDTSFGENGELPIESVGVLQLGTAMVVLDDDSLVLAVARFVSSVLQTHIVRITPEGRLDPAFGSLGRMDTLDSSTVFQLAKTSQGKIIATGTFDDGTNVLFSVWAWDFRSVANSNRYTYRGPSFGIDAEARAIAILSDNRFVVGGNEDSQLVYRVFDFGTAADSP